VSFRVEPPALRAYAGQLADAHQVADVAKRYVHQHGDFSLHERGLMGMVAPGHRHLLAALDDLLGHLGALTGASADALRQVAARYERSDLRAEGAIDASYPAVPRPAPSRD
jgi:phosphoglycolate phosphatase-like HAD superfamily hydrolase